MKLIPRGGSDGPTVNWVDLVRTTTDHLYDPPVTTVNTYPDNVAQKLSSSSWSGADIEGFHRLLNSGVLLPHTPFSSFIERGEWTLGGLHIKQYNKASGKLIWEREDSHYMGLSSDTALVDFSGVDNLLSIVPSDLDYMAQAAAARIYSKGFDAATFVAELKDLRRTFGGVLHDALTVKKNVLKKIGKAAKDPKKVIKYMENAYLELRYGWRPLLGEIKEFDQVYHEFDEKRSRWSERVGLTERNANVDESSSDSTFGTHYITTTTVDEISRRGSVTADAAIAKFSANAALTGWEVIPYSFVVDWFFSVQQSLAASSLLAIADAYSASTGFKIKRTVNRVVHLTVDGETSVTYYQGDSPLSSMDYQAIYSKRIPTSVSISPFSEVKLDVWKGLDALALLHQIFGKR